MVHGSVARADVIVHLVSFGKLKLPGAAAWADEYRKRLQGKKGLSVEETEFPDPKESTSPSRALGEWLTKRKIPKNAVFLLDEGGVNWSTREWANRIQEFLDRGPSSVVFAIGPHAGWDEEARTLSSRRISFGRQTLAHDLARVALLEQIYRALSLLEGHPYHRE